MKLPKKSGASLVGVIAMGLILGIAPAHATPTRVAAQTTIVGSVSSTNALVDPRPDVNRSLASRGNGAEKGAGGAPNESRQGTTSERDLQSGKWRRIINWLKDKVPEAFNKLKAAAKNGFRAFRRAWERFVPWIVRKTAAVLWTLWEIYEAFREIFG